MIILAEGGEDDNQQNVEYQNQTYRRTRINHWFTTLFMDVTHLSSLLI
ncbi:hypothetical protein [Paenibacillus sp. GCM10028914]